MEKIGTGVFQLAELVLAWINPAPIIVADLQSATLITRLCIFGLLASSYMGATSKRSIFGPVQDKIIAIVAALMGVRFLPDPLIVELSLVYLAMSRIIEGLSFGAGLAVIYRQTRGTLAVVAVPLAQVALPLQVYTIASFALSGVGLFSTFRSAPYFGEHPVLTLTIVGVCLSGMLVAPNLDQRTNLFFLTIFPITAIAGFVGGAWDTFRAKTPVVK